MSPTLARAVPAVLSRVKHAFDLACDPAVVAATLGPLAAARPGLRVPGTFDGFELAARAIVGQQISVRAARTVLGRLARNFGDAATIDGGDALTRLFPTAARIAAVAPRELVDLGLTQARARALIGLAAAVASGRIPLEPESDVEAAVAALAATARGSARGPRITSRCGRCAGRTRSSPTTSSC